MSHDPANLSVLNLEDPIDQEISKLHVTIQDLLRTSKGFSAGTNISQLRNATQRGGIDALSTLALDLFPGMVLPDFLQPFETQEVSSDPGAPKHIEEELQLQDTFGLLFSDALATVRDGTGREDLVREGP